MTASTDHRNNDVTRTATPHFQPGTGAPPGALRLDDQFQLRLHFTLAGTKVDVTLPPLDKLAFYVGLTGAAVLGVIEWPIALLTGVGHLLSDDRGNRALRALDESLDAA